VSKGVIFERAAAELPVPAIRYNLAATPEALTAGDPR
jgi:hypothetical protein